MRLASLWTAAWLLAACTAAGTPLLRIAPSALERTLSIQQQLTVHAGERTERIDALLEADAHAVRLALVSLGQVGARLEWDGRELRQSQAAWWPRAVSAERVLSEMQLVLWPDAAVRQALPAGWTLEAAGGERLLLQGREVVVRIRYPSANRAELVHLREGYRIVIDTLGAEAES